MKIELEIDEAQIMELVAGSGMRALPEVIADEFRRLGIEKEAELEPDAKWEVVLFNPLEGATWLRDKETKVWRCTERNQGFA